VARILLVDGYNIIGHWAELSRLREQSLEEARARLCGILSRYLTFHWDRIIVVFDAYQVSGAKQGNPGEAPFAVIFSGAGESADLAIERLTGQWVREGHHVEVATSDALEQMLIFGKGAVRISARELKQQLLELDREMSHNHGETGHSGLMLDGRLDGHTRAVLERWRRKR
jgi:uncharacterized protein